MKWHRPTAGTIRYFNITSFVLVCLHYFEMAYVSFQLTVIYAINSIFF